MSIIAYDIGSDIPGGEFTPSMLYRLTLLIARDIETKLTNTQIHQSTLKLTFGGSLSAEEKTTLDEDTRAPAGGIIAASTDKVVISVDGVPKTDNARLDIPADRISFKTVTLQKQRYDGSPAAGEQEIVALEVSAVGAINTLDGEFDANGEFSFILGPDVRRGSFNMTIGIANFSSTPLSVRFH